MAEIQIDGPHRPAANGALRAGASVLALALVIAGFAMAPGAAAQLPPEYARCAAAAAMPEQAIAACSAIIQSGRDAGRNLALSFFNRGIAWTRKSDSDRALADFNRAIQVDATYARAYSARGAVYGKQGQTDLALIDFNRAIALDPHCAPARANRASALMRSRDLDGALADAEAAIRIDPNYARGYTARAAVYLRRNGFALALADANRALALDPALAAAYDTRGVIHARQRHFDQAISDFDQAIRLDPFLAAAYNDRGLTYRNRNDPDRAIGDLTRAIALNPKYAFAYNNRGLALRDKGEIDRAVSDFTEAIRLDGRYASAFVNRGLAFERKGLRERALADYTAALAIEPERSEALAGRTRLAAAAAPPATDTARFAGRLPSTGSTTLPAKPGTTLASKPQTADAASRPATDGVAAPAAAVAAVPVRRSLAEALLACSVPHGGKPLPIEDSGGDRKAAFPACYHGRRHLDCVVGAIADEAGAIDREYGEIVATNYVDLNNVEAICRLDPARVEVHLAKSKTLDARVAALQKAYDASATCLENVRRAIGQIDISSQTDAGALMGSMTASISKPIEQAAARQRDVFRLVHGIQASQKTMLTVRNIRAAVCP